jgi:hypothetical protein
MVRFGTATGRPEPQFDGVRDCRAPNVEEGAPR